MSTTAISLEQLDTDISLAYVALRIARSTYQRSPNAGNARLVADAEGIVDRLLDERFAAQD